MPNSETFCISASEMFFPRFCDFITSFLYQLLEFHELLSRKPNIIRQCDGWFDPELCFAIWTRHVNMRSTFFTREKIKSIILVPKYRWAHEFIISISTSIYIFIRIENRQRMKEGTRVLNMVSRVATCPCPHRWKDKPNSESTSGFNCLI